MELYGIIAIELLFIFVLIMICTLSKSTSTSSSNSDYDPDSSVVSLSDSYEFDSDDDIDECEKPLLSQDRSSDNKIHFGPSFKQLYKSISEFNENNNNNIRILSLGKVKKGMNTYEGKMIDVGTCYLGMGHFIMISYVPATDNFIFRRDGGSNGLEAEDYYNKYSAKTYSPKNLPLLRDSKDVTRDSLFVIFPWLSLIKFEAQYNYDEMANLVKLINSK